MIRANDNEAITKRQPASARLPVLFLGRKDVGDGWVTSHQSTHLHGQRITLSKRYPVRVVPVSALDQFVKTRRTELGAVPKDFAHQLFSMLGIAGATLENDPRKAAKLAQRAALQATLAKGEKGTVAASWDKLSTFLSPWDKVAATLNTGLFGAVPVLWQKGTQLAPALLCQTPAQALFAHALFRVSGKHGLGVCSRCGNPFFASREQHVFCSYQCRVAAAMKRYRRNLKRRRAAA